MAADRSPPARAPLWRRLGPMERLVATAIAAVALGGLLLIADGVYIKAKAALSQVLLERSFQAGTRPWSWADFTVTARVSAPRLGASAIVLSEASGEALAFGPAHLPETPPPGEEGTAVIAAHRDTHFRWLKDVRPGDTIDIERADGRRFRFVAGETRIVRWDRSGIDPAAFGRNLVLATCWPFEATAGGGPLRYLVEAALVEETTPAPLRMAALAEPSAPPIWEAYRPHR